MYLEEGEEQNNLTTHGCRYLEWWLVQEAVAEVRHLWEEEAEEEEVHEVVLQAYHNKENA
jgi:hypothetical protein